MDSNYLFKYYMIHNDATYLDRTLDHRFNNLVIANHYKIPPVIITDIKHKELRCLKQTQRFVSFQLSGTQPLKSSNYYLINRRKNVKINGFLGFM